MNLNHHIDIQIEAPVTSLDVRPLEKAALTTLRLDQVAEPCEVVIVISDDETLRDLNRRFRGLDRPTDVLSFADDTRGPFSGGAAGFPRYLGDVVISWERAQAQAEAVGTTLMQELQLLVVHGLLHLLGYDHADPETQAQMWRAQQVVLGELGVAIPLPE